MPPRLLALTDGPDILLDKPIILLGRHQECDIQLNSRKISRRHCCIAQVNDYLVVRDLSSTNGIRVNGVRVLEGSLRAGDQLTIGNFQYQVIWEMVGPPLPASGPPKLAGLFDDDDPLVSFEQPVPLAEPGDPAQALRRPAPVAAPAGMPPVRTRAENKPIPPPDAPPSLIPPDEH